jgi:hypothetical protein
MRYRELIEAQSAQFVLPKAFPARNYHITASLKDIGIWEAKILAANSPRVDQHIGDWDKVGYVMINLKSNELIPIARADEHNTGFDLLYKVSRGNRLFNVDDYKPIYFGPNYLYKESDIPPMTIAVSKWLSYGGPDLTIKGVYGLNLFGSFTDLVRHKMQLIATSDKLAPVGERLINAFSALQKVNDRRVLLARSNRDTSAIDQTFFRAAHALVKMIAPIMQAMWIDQPDPMTLVDTVQTFIDTQDIAGLETFLFSHRGVKNAIHMTIRKTKAGDYIRSDTVQAIFGNLDLADQMLGKL